MNSSKKRTNEFVFTTMRRVFIRFLEEIEDTKIIFRNYLTLGSPDYMVIVEMFLKKTCCNEKFIAFFFH